MFEESQGVDCAFVFDLSQHAVDDDVGSGPADPCTERAEKTSNTSEPREELLNRPITVQYVCYLGKCCVT